VRACTITVVCATTGLVALLCTYITTLETEEQGRTDGQLLRFLCDSSLHDNLLHRQQSSHVCAHPLLCLSLSLSLSLCLCSCTIEEQSCFSLHDAGIDSLVASKVMAILVTSLQRILLAAILAKSSSCSNVCKESFLQRSLQGALLGAIFAKNSFAAILAKIS